MSVLTLLASCMGCVTLGPKVEKKTVYVNKYDSQGRPIVIGTVDKNVRIPLRYITKDGGEYVEEIDIGGFDVSPKPLPKPENPADKAILGQYIK